MAVLLANLGSLAAHAQGDHQRAVEHLQEALTLFRRLGDQASIARCLDNLVEVLAARQQPLLAARLAGAADALREAIGVSTPTACGPAYRRGPYAAAWAAGRDLPIERAIAEASTLAAPTPTPDPAPPRRPEQPTPTPPCGLSGREAEVLRLLASGLTNVQIADRLALSPHTIDAHLRRVYRKLGVRSRGAATRFAVEHGLA